MRVLYLIVAIVLFNFLGPANAGPTPEKPWYELAEEIRPTSLKVALAEERKLLGDGNPFWTGHQADKKTCAVLKQVKLTCDYNTRISFIVVFPYGQRQGIVPCVRRHESVSLRLDTGGPVHPYR